VTLNANDSSQERQSEFDFAVKSCMPNHLIARDRFLSSFFHRDLLFAITPQGKKIGIPALHCAQRWIERAGTASPIP
jgi:hypothetical protein